ncbi:TPR end-of-group domain-containing protein [Robiginitalea sp. IMCC44478]|uniref:TPR end-of-group domain-containing protein n=1 Tax=Robiginitalea sp. IMCC44478 TaxID=3459122 RepID=UPI0040430378
MDFKNYFEELKRRKVIKAAIAYGAVAWVLIEVASAVLPAFDAPPVVLKALIILLALGFFVMLVFSWVYDVTPEGIRKTDDLDDGHEMSRIKNRRLNWVLITFLSVAVILLLYNQFRRSTNHNPDTSGEVALAEPTSASIAVLPFKNWSGDPSLEYVSDGMADEISTKLERIDAVEKVIPFVDMLKFKTMDISLRSLCDTLGVQYVLDGSVQISGDQIRVRVQLLNGQANDYVWSDDFTGNWNTNDLFSIQAKVAENVLRRLTDNLDAEEQTYLDYMSTDNMEAYTYYLKGVHQANKASADGIRQAIANLQTAVEQDPGFVEAWINLGSVWMNSGLYFGIYPEQEAWQNAKKAYQQVIERASGKTEYLKVFVEGNLLWYSYLYDWNFMGVEQAYKTEVEDESLKTLFEVQTGRYEEALETNKRITKYFTDRGDIPFGRTVGYRAMTLYYLGRYGEAKDKLEEYADLLWDDPTYLMESAKWYYYLGAYPESRKSLEHLREDFKDESPIVWFLTAAYAHDASDEQQLQTALTELQQKYEAQKSGSPAWNLALYYAHVGDYNTCLDWLQRSYDRHEIEMIWLRAEPLLAPIRNNPRYLAMYKGVEYPVPPLGVPEGEARKIN